MLWACCLVEEEESEMALAWEAKSKGSERIRQRLHCVSVFVSVSCVLWRTFADVGGQSKRYKWRIISKPATKPRIFLGAKRNSERAALQLDHLALKHQVNF